jgi:EAL domain-containing protein (putative c-di-GMP-specific phosphodiesterase class I)
MGTQFGQGYLFQKPLPLEQGTAAAQIDNLTQSLAG